MAKQREAPGGSQRIRAARDAKANELQRQHHEIQKPWWALEGEAAAARANEWLSNCMANDRDRQNDLAYWANLYRQGRMLFAGTIQGADKSVYTGARYRQVDSLAATFNGIQSAIDTVSNTVAQHKPAVQFTATAGDWNSHKIARMRAQFIAGWFYEQRIYEKTARQFTDSAMWGDGAVGVFKRNGRAVAERVFPGDLYIDQTSCITNNNPREMGRIHLMDRHTAWMMFDGNKEAQKKIEMAPQVSLSVDSVFTNSDMIQLNELWRLPTCEGADDGCHLLATQLDDLEMEPWEHDNFPIAFINCIPSPFGFWSQGLSEVLCNLQLNYNDNEAAINLAQELGRTYHLFVQSNSNLVVDNIDNFPGSVLRGDGPPQSLLWQCVQPELYAKQEARKRQFFEQSGVAQMAATNDDVDEAESGIAIRHRVGIYDERHALWTQSYQNAHLTLAKLAIQTISDILKEKKEYAAADKPVPPYQVFSVGRPEAIPIDFEELHFEQGEQFILSCVPVNDLPDKVEGRIALAQEFVNAGYYDERTAREVFLAPFDTQRIETLYNATRDYFSMVLDAIVEKGTDPPAPDGNDKLDVGLQMALQHLAYAKLRDVSIARQDKLTKYITALKVKLLEKQKGDATLAMQVPPPAQPLASPEAPPTSPLVPSPNAAPTAQA